MRLPRQSLVRRRSAQDVRGTSEHWNAKAGRPAPGLEPGDRIDVTGGAAQGSGDAKHRWNGGKGFTPVTVLILIAAFDQLRTLGPARRRTALLGGNLPAFQRFSIDWSPAGVFVPAVSV